MFFFFVQDPDSYIYRNLPSGAMLEWELDRADEEIAKETDVQCILEKRVLSFGVQYLVKWRDFDWSHNSWIHASDTPSDMVAEFEESLAAAKEDNFAPKTRFRSKAESVSTTAIKRR
jgi:hypothetical protein